jgi:hypothetical protein
MTWEELARFVIAAGRVEDADPEMFENEVLFEALEQGATQAEAQEMARKAREWYERD